MSYSIERHEPVDDALHRIADEQVEQALASLDAASDENLVAGVHDARKRCKKLRGLIRLVRPPLGDAYEAANKAFRDAARALSDTRDAQSLVSTFDHLVAATDGDLGADHEPVRSWLAARADAAETSLRDDPVPIAAARELVLEGRAVVAAARVGGAGFDAIDAGLAKTYARARDRMATARAEASDENLHQWRKRVKYSWYHVRLLADSAPSLTADRAGLLHDLSDVLGDDHDLAVLLGLIHDAEEAVGGPIAVAALDRRITAVRADLQRRAFGVGARLFVDDPDAYVARFRGWWDAWHDLGAEPAAGELAAIGPLGG